MVHSALTGECDQGQRGPKRRFPGRARGQSVAVLQLHTADPLARVSKCYPYSYPQRIAIWKSLLSQRLPTQDRLIGCQTMFGKGGSRGPLSASGKGTPHRAIMWRRRHLTHKRGAHYARIGPPEKYSGPKNFPARNFPCSSTGRPALGGRPFFRGTPIPEKFLEISQPEPRSHCGQ